MSGNDKLDRSENSANRGPTYTENAWWAINTYQFRLQKNENDQAFRIVTVFD